MFKFLQEKSFRSVRHAGEYLDYLFYAPETADAPLPLVIYIHGAGSRGDSLQ